MARWLHPMVLIMFISSTNLENDSCQNHLSTLNWPQLTCTGLTSFKHYQTLNRTHWIKCVDCTLTTIDSNTFQLKRNNVSYLELQQNGIEQLKKNSFKCFYVLKLLNLRGNRIEYMEPLCFTGLKRLMQLDLSHNSLKIVTDNVFQDLYNLDILNLSYNQIFFIQPYAFAGLVNLKYLYLNYNDLKKIEDRIFRHMTNLKILYIEHNSIVEIHQNAFANLHNLHFLYLNNNSISYLVQYNFKPLTSLVDLQLRSNNLTEIQVSSFNGLKNLKSLYLGDNQISLIKPYGFIGLDSLFILDLVSNNFTIVDLTYFDKITTLYALWLGNNVIEELFVNPQTEIQSSLKILDLTFNVLNEFDYELLLNKLPNLLEIHLDNNTFNCDFFSGMYEYFEDRNVSVCMSQACDGYNESFCINTTETTTLTVLNSTYPINFSVKIQNNVSMFFLCLLLFC